jgi:hypothetical protein
MKLKDAIDVVNRTRRRATDPPLVRLAKCDICREEFAMLPQAYSFADVQGHPKVCRPCSVERRRKARRVSR